MSARLNAHVTRTKVAEHLTGISSATGTGIWNETVIETGSESVAETESGNERGPETGAETESETGSGTGKETETANETESENESETETDPSDVNPIMVNNTVIVILKNL